MQKCEYGCGKEGKYQLKNGKLCCSESVNSCEGKKAKHDQYGEKNPMFGKSSWNKSLTIENERVKKNVEAATKTIKKQFEEGREVWNKSLTIEDERVKKNVEAATKTIKKQFEEGREHPLKGKKNRKRRVPINENNIINFFKYAIRNRIQYLWRKRVISVKGKKCEKCESNSNIEVHHKTSFNEIFERCWFKNIKIKDNKIDIDEIEKLYDDIYEEHTIDISIVLCKKCHSIIDKFRN